MNQEQLTSLFRTVSQIGGTLLASYGYGTAESWQSVAGALIVIASTGWSLYSNRSAGLVAKAAALPAVKTVSVTDPALAAAASQGAAASSSVVVAR